MLYAIILAALMAGGVYVSIPIPGSPVPVVLANLFVLLAGMLLGRKWGLISVGIYLLLGVIGLPVFSGAKGGLAHFAGPTGGYLIGYAVAVFVIGWIVEKGDYTIKRDILAGALGYLIIFALGVPWLAAHLDISLSEGMAKGMIPFIPGAIIKLIIAVGLVGILRPIIKNGYLTNFVE